MSTASYFSPAHQRLFFLYGQLEDQFCLAANGFLNIDQLLQHYLRQLGYQRIAFYNGRHKLYFLDQRSYQLARPGGQDNPQSSEQDQQPRRSKIVGGRLGAKRLRQAAAPAAETQSTPPPHNGIFNYGGMNDLEIVNTVDRWMNETQPQTAIIFSNGIDFINHFEAAAQRQMASVLNDWLRITADNHNICIFLLQTKDMQRLRELLQRQPHWHVLMERMFEENRPSRQMIALSAPQEDEVRQLLHHYRLRHQIAVDWRIFPQAVAQVARATRSHQRSLKDLNIELQKCQQLDKAAFAALAGRVETESALERLQAMPGVSNIAERIQRLVRRFTAELQPQTHTARPRQLTVQRLLPQNDAPAKGINLHLALIGNPGTGKTTIARLIGEIYRDAGLLSSGHTVKASREELVSGYVGQTALQTAQLVADAMGGVLFVDEAYRLTQGGDNDFGREAVETILEAMSNHLGEFAVIIAGYPRNIQQFIDSNPGLKRRFSERNLLTIADYTPEVLQQIFQQHVAKQGRTLAADLQEQLPNFFQHLYAERDLENFGNAGEVIDNIYPALEEQRIERISATEPVNDDRQLTLADVPEQYRAYLKPRQPDDPREILQTLDHLVGLSSVKSQIRNLVNSLILQRRRGQQQGQTPGHYLFLGNPGTGKTTVARLMGNILKSLGLLERGQFLEKTRPDFVAGYQGQTAEKTTALLTKALDNVLFIDEAYQLISDERDSFGKEAVETLVAFMENNRDRLCIIAAGYPETMQRFIQSNPGLQSRFSAEIVFEDYNAAEMWQIFVGMAAEQHLTLGEGVEAASMAIFQHWEQQRTAHFGNGRDVRKLLEAAFSNLNNRLVEQDIHDAERLNMLEAVDIPNLTST